ncbi:MAG: hypothetical protein JW966_13685 [Anaerolineae bacterium]|nr:hypothetical protein [Anaerolineae bacterium]
MKNHTALLWLVIDGLALVGVVAFSVLASIDPDQQAYILGQIVCAVLILISVFVLRRMRVDRMS